LIVILRVLLPRAAQNFPKAIFRDWLKQIVESVHLKSTQCIPIVCGDEDDLRHFCVPNAGNAMHDIEPIRAGHLHVEKHEIWLVLRNRGDRGFPTVGFTHDLHAGLGTQQAQDFSARRGFVIYDENLKCIG
jgi:hypothetical protein